MKYKMKHAREQDKKRKAVVKRKTLVKRKAVVTILSIIVGIAVIILVVLNFQVISGFINSKINILSSRLSGNTGEKNEESTGAVEEIMVEDISTENNTSEGLPEEELPDAADDGDDSQNEDEKNTEESIKGAVPTIELEVYEGPLYSTADDICFYRIRAIVTGEPYPEINFSKDDSLGSLGPGKAQINIKRDSKTYILTATASNSEGKASDTRTLVWDCNRSPDIKGISLSSDAPYVGKQHEVSVEAVDLDDDELTYSWSVTGGSIVDDTINPIKWNTPDAPGDYEVTVAVDDGEGNTSETSVGVYVGEVTAAPEQQSTSLNLPRKEGEGGYIEFEGDTHNGGDIYAGDTSNNKSCMGFVSFDISGLSGGTVETASLTFSDAAELGAPLSFLYRLKINVLDWGAEPITQDDFDLVGIFVASYDYPNITCNVSKLKDELQKAINEGKSRFQIRIHFSGPWTDDDSEYDGWRYLQSNVNLNVTITR